MSEQSNTGLQGFVPADDPRSSIDPNWRQLVSEQGAYLVNRDNDEDPDVRQARTAKAVADARRAVIAAAMDWLAGYEVGEDLDFTGKDQRLVECTRALQRAVAGKGGQV